MPFVPKNYMTDGGNETVIGGKLTIKPGAKVSGIARVPDTGTTGHYLKKTSSGCSWATLPSTPDASTTTKGLVKQAAAVADATGEAPTAAEFNALLAALKSAGLMSST